MKKKKRYTQEDVVNILDKKVDTDFGGSIAKMAEHFGTTRVFMGNVLAMKRKPTSKIIIYALGESFKRIKIDIYANPEEVFSSAAA